MVGWLGRVKERAPGRELPSSKYRKSFDDDHGFTSFSSRVVRRKVQNMQPSGTREVFISHATEDKPLAEALGELIELGLGLTHDQIFCSSLAGQGIPAGSDFKGHIIRRTYKLGCCDCTANS